MVTRKKYIDSMAATLLEWSAQITDLQWRANSAGLERQDQIRQQIIALRSRRAAYEEQHRDAGKMSAAVFRDMRRAADGSATEFRKIYIEAVSRFAS